MTHDVDEAEAERARGVVRDVIRRTAYLHDWDVRVDADVPVERDGGYYMVAVLGLLHPLPVAPCASLP